MSAPTFRTRKPLGHSADPVKRVSDRIERKRPRAGRIQGTAEMRFSCRVTGKCACGAEFEAEVTDVSLPHGLAMWEAIEIAMIGAPVRAGWEADECPICPACMHRGRAKTDAEFFQRMVAHGIGHSALGRAFRLSSGAVYQRVKALNEGESE